MAVVNVDLSEYDMLREAKAKAEKELEKVQKELEGLKRHSSCVVKARYYVPMLDFDKAAKCAINKYLLRCQHIYYQGLREFAFGLSPYSPISKNINEQDKQEIFNMFQLSIREGLEEANRQTEYSKKGSYMEDHTSVEIIGFEEIRSQIEQRITEQFAEAQQSRLQELDHKIGEYNLMMSDLEAKMEAKYSKTIKKLETKIKEQEEEHTKEIDSLIETHKESIKKLEKELSEAKKTQAEKEAEAEAKVQAAIAELEAIKGSSMQETKKKKFLGLFS